MTEVRRCPYCYRSCRLDDGDIGWCRVTQNDRGVFKAVSSQRYGALHIDPIEKKPLYHFYPGSATFSLGMTGCNLSCDFCQNHSLVQGEGAGMQDIADSAILAAIEASRSPIISYTYSEPIVWQSSLRPIAESVHRKGLLNVLVTNGTFSQWSLNNLQMLIDALNIDLKGDEQFYRKVCHAKGAYRSVLDSIDFWVNHTESVVEVTSLIIEGFHTPGWVRETGCLLKEIGVKVWHLSRFFPAFRMADRAPTSLSCMMECFEEAQKSGVDHVYPGNMEHPSAHSLKCPQCSCFIPRKALNELADSTHHLRCPRCGFPMYGRYGTIDV